METLGNFGREQGNQDRPWETLNLLKKYDAMTCYWQLRERVKGKGHGVVLDRMCCLPLMPGDLVTFVYRFHCWNELESC